MYRSYADSGRAKRDLDVDPEELLALMTLLEAERKQNKVHEQSRHVKPSCTDTMFKFIFINQWPRRSHYGGKRGGGGARSLDGEKWGTRNLFWLYPVHIAAV